MATRTHQTSKVRHANRLPTQTRKLLWWVAAGTMSAAEGKRLKQKAWALLRAHVKEHAALKLKNKVKAGFAIKRIIKLTPIAAVKLSDKPAVYDSSVWLPAAVAHFEQKRRCGDTRSRERLVFS